MAGSLAAEAARAAEDFDAAAGDVVKGGIPMPSGGLAEFLKDSTHGIFRR